MEKEVIIGTHSGTFHTDEVMSVMLLRTFLPYYKNAKLIRTRDMKILEKLDTVVDVGGIYDNSQKRYDHHQSTFNEKFNENYKTKLCSSGLIYKHFGLQIISQGLNDLFIDPLEIQKMNINQNQLEEILYKLDIKYKVQINQEQLNKIYQQLYQDFFECIDGIDNGISPYQKECKSNYRHNSTDIFSRIQRLNKNGLLLTDLSSDQLFEKAQQVAYLEFMCALKTIYIKQILSYQFVKQDLLNRYNVHPSGRILRLTQFYPWKQTLQDLEQEMQIKEPIYFVIFQDDNDMQYRVSTVPLNRQGFELRKGLKESWRGLRDAELQQVSGINDAIFCHSSGFLGVCEGFEGTLKMAVQSLDENNINSISNNNCIN